LRRLSSIFSERGAALDELASESCGLIAMKLAPLCKDPAAAPELLGGLLGVVHVILGTHFKAFTVTAMEGDGPATVSPVGAAHPLFGGGGGGLGLKKRVTRFKSEEK
jgi:hypothetical protein